MSCNQPAESRIGLIDGATDGCNWMLMSRVRPSHCDSNARPNEMADIKKNPFLNGFFLMLSNILFKD